MTLEKKGLYIETTIPSYATTWNSKNPLTFERQTITRKFWEEERHNFNLYVSYYVIAECSDGDPEAAKARLDFLKNIYVFPQTPEVEELAAIYQKLLSIPEEAKMDCSHLAVCVLNRVDFLLTWNFTHLGEASYRKAQEYNTIHSLWTPALVTPETIYSYLTEVV
jgi:hypothetical protein